MSRGAEPSSRENALLLIISAVHGHFRALLQQLLALHTLRVVRSALLRHCELVRQLPAAQHEIGVVSAPVLDERTRILNNNVQRVHVLLNKPKHVKIVADRFRQIIFQIISLAHLRQVAGRVDKCHVHIQIVGVLDASHHLCHLVVEVGHTLVTHHEIVLHGNRQTLPNRVARKALFPLCKSACCGFVRHTRGETLVKRPHVPLDFTVGVVHVHVRQDNRGKRRICGICNQAVHAVGNPLIGALQCPKKSKIPHRIHGSKFKTQCFAIVTCVSYTVTRVVTPIFLLERSDYELHKKTRHDWHHSPSLSGKSPSRRRVSVRGPFSGFGSCQAAHCNHWARIHSPNPLCLGLKHRCEQ